jgi:hypothetical protein
MKKKPALLLARDFCRESDEKTPGKAHTENW